MWIGVQLLECNNREMHMSPTWFLVSEVQGKTPPPPSQVTSGWLLRLNASSVKWGNMFLARKVIRRGRGASHVKVLSKAGEANQVHFPFPCPVLSPASATPFSELRASGFGSFLH